MRNRLFLIGLLLILILSPSLIPAGAQETAVPPAFPGDGPYWDVAAAAARIKPSVVGIVAFKPPLFSGGQERLSGGTGVVYKPGYVVTAAHLVSGASKVQLLLHNNSLAVVFPQEIKTDPVTGLAVLRFNAASLPAPVWADSDRAMPGQLAIAVGNPFGFRLGNTVTTGTISSLGRVVTGTMPRRTRGYDLPLLQTDTPINPGNDGGPLVNAKGEVIGLAWHELRVPGADSVSFALPANLVKQVADELIARGAITRPWLGLELEERMTASLGGPAAGGLLVVDVAPDGPAAGQVESGDQLLQVGDTSVNTVEDLVAAVAGLQVGEPVSLTLRRGQADRTVTITPAALPNSYRLPVDNRVWAALSLDQVAAAADWAMAHRSVPLADLTAPYRATAPLGEALLRTEFLHLAHTVHQTLTAGGRVTDNELLQWALSVRDLEHYEVAVRTRPTDLPLQAAVQQGSRTFPARLVTLPTGVADPAVGSGVAADANRPDLTRVVFAARTHALWPTEPITLVVRSAAGEELARFDWDYTQVR